MKYPNILNKIAITHEMFCFEFCVLMSGMPFTSDAIFLLVEHAFVSKLLVILFSFVLKTLVVNIGLTAAIIYPTDSTK